MIRHGELRCDTLHEWLQGDVQGNTAYRHRLLRENTAFRPQALIDLRLIFGRVHRDAKRHLAAVVADDLDPVTVGLPAPWDGYPTELHDTTKQGYFGEILAAVLAENLSPFDENCWRVPVVLFRFHLSALQIIERTWQGGRSGTAIPGRPGDDCLAFVLSNRGEITKVLYAEAKCCLQHQTVHLRKAHKQVGSAPADLPKLIEVLKDYSGDAEADFWRKALRNLWLRQQVANPIRHNLVVYVCGKSPSSQRRRSSWLDRGSPCSAYRSTSALEAVEIHLQGIADLVRGIYEDLVVAIN